MNHEASKTLEQLMVVGLVLDRHLQARADRIGEMVDQSEGSVHPLRIHGRSCPALLLPVA